MSAVPLFFLIFNHLRLRIAVARHNLKWFKILKNSLAGFGIRLHLVARRCTLSNDAISVTKYGDQTGEQYSRKPTYRACDR